MSAGYEVFEKFFAPSSVALIGASPVKGTIGRAIMDNLIEKFKGRIYPVNIKYDEVLGFKAYKSCLELPEAPDLIVVAVPAKAVPSVLDECGSRGVKAAIVISAGFKEIGPQGESLEKELVSIAKKHGMRVVGPNCLGIYDAYTGLDTIFNPSDRQSKPPPGDVAFISQSGALGAAVLDWLSEAGVGMSKFVSYGNAADVKEWELIEFLAHDPKTKVILTYIEGVEDGRKFLNSIRTAVRLGKPVVVLKAGKSEKGMRAVASHTGSLAGSYQIYEAALKQAGAIVVKELNELILVAKTLSWLPTPKGNKLAIVTNGGGAGVLATDAAELEGLKIAELSDEVKEYLKKELPPAASVQNPVDILGDAPPARYKVAVEAVLRDNNVDLVLVITLMQSPAFEPLSFIKELSTLAKLYKKPIVLASPGGSYTEKYTETLEREVRIPAFKTPEEAVKALRYAFLWSEILKKHQHDMIDIKA